MSLIDITGMVFGRLKVIRQVQKPQHIKTRASFWLCECSCGNISIVRGTDLRRGRTRSCGCYNREVTSKRASTMDGLTVKYKNEYYVWKNIISRTTDPENPYFRRYGGRGIKICSKWENSFAEFINDMGKRPVINCHRVHIDRINNDGDYEPGNCRWVTSKENIMNSSTPKFIIDPFDGEKLCKSDMAKKYHISRENLKDRLKCGWTIERALTQTVKYYNLKTR